MFILMNAINMFASVLNVLIFANVIISWVPIRKDHPIFQLLFALTDPILMPIRTLLQKSPLGGPGMMLDFSPVIALFLIQIVKTLLLSVVSMLLA